MRECWSQDDGTVRVEWGPVGAESLVSYAAERGPVVAVVVDVLSFTTCRVRGRRRGDDGVAVPVEGRLGGRVRSRT